MYALCGKRVFVSYFVKKFLSKHGVFWHILTNFAVKSDSIECCLVGNRSLKR